MALPYKASSQDGIDFIECLETMPKGGTLGDVKKAIETNFWILKIIDP